MASQQGIPRKFSEKIAILERKQNEEEQQVLGAHALNTLDLLSRSLQFHSVMRDVRALTSKAGSGNVNVNAMNSPMSAYASGAQQQYDSSAMAQGEDTDAGGQPQPFIVGAPPHPLLPMQWNRYVDHTSPYAKLFYIQKITGHCPMCTSHFPLTPRTDSTIGISNGKLVGP